MQAALDDLPELKADLQKMMMIVVAETPERNPNEAGWLMTIARQTYDVLKEISIALDARRICKQDVWTGKEANPCQRPQGVHRVAGTSVIGDRRGIH